MASPPLHLALELDGDGAHPAAWRRSRHAPADLLTARRVERVARHAENAGFTVATFDDGALPPPGGPVGRIGAVERAAFAAPLTSTIGLVPVLATTYNEPFHVSSQLASLDWASAGRAGWIVGAERGAARSWGRPPVEGDAAVRREARDAVVVGRALWDSWEDDAAIRDVDTGRYLDRDKLHYIDFVGEAYTVKGPAIVPRPPQGQLVVFAPDGLVPPELVDVALVEEPARVDGVPLTFAEVEVALDTADASADERVAALDGWPGSGRRRHTGSAEGLVALLTELAGAVDGVRLHPLVLDEDLPVLSARVLPALFERGLATRPMPGSSLRTTLGLPRPANRYAPEAS